ncbi:hypothetical protein SDC9_210063 [bioreactor metagenome]|uniref:Uncharacterized protein n=1 Tax=bioreactor metagenome TaxID=1076179 RepID=A0A645JFR6_9ZZZZ
MIDGRPGGAQLLGRHIQHGGNVVPCRREVGFGDGFQRVVRSRDERVDGRAYVRRLDAVERREAVVLKKWIAAHAGILAADCS